MRAIIVHLPPSPIRYILFNNIFNELSQLVFDDVIVDNDDDNGEDDNNCNGSLLDK